VDGDRELTNRGPVETKHVYLAASGADPDRIRALAQALVHCGFDVIVDPSAGGEWFARELEYASACVVVAWGAGPPDQTALAAAANAQRTSVLVPVTLDAGAAVTPPFDGLDHVDLGGWTGTPGDPAFATLLQRVRAMVEHPVTSSRDGTLDDRWTVTDPQHALDALTDLTRRVGRLVDVFSDDPAHTDQIRKTLGEIGATYKVVKDAIEEFVAAGLPPGGVDRQAFARLERGGLAHAIRNGRGHCTRMGAQYWKVGGLREGLLARGAGPLISEADDTFTRLTQSDFDLLATMDSVGVTLTAEARQVVRLLFAGQEAAARQRVAQGREAILPLEDALDAAIATFQEIEESLGYAEATPTKVEAAHVNMQTITIMGNVTNSNVVAAATIERSALSAGAATGASDDLKALLGELHEAVAALTTRLPDDGAELAARDLKDLTEEVVSGAPRPAFWRRAADGLLAAARKVTDVGLPVADLVTKVLALV
jgi:hypothetical protein